MNQTVSLEDATETVYASRYSPQESPEGNYTCSVQSVGTEIKRNSSSMIFESECIHGLLHMYIVTCNLSSRANNHKSKFNFCKYSASPVDSVSCEP